MIVLLAIVVFIFKFFWLLLAVAGAVFVGVSVGKSFARHDDWRMARWRRNTELCARADEQNRWFVAGDQRGVYGRYPPAQTPSKGDKRPDGTTIGARYVRVDEMDPLLRWRVLSQRGATGIIRERTANVEKVPQLIECSGSRTEVPQSEVDRNGCTICPDCGTHRQVLDDGRIRLHERVVGKPQRTVIRKGSKHGARRVPA